MTDSSMLDGTTVLDLSSVGPAARASRWLADYGADVVKVAPMPRDGDAQIAAPAYAYGAHRGMRRVSIDLKAEPGRAAFLRLVADADVVIESFRPGVIDRLDIGYEVMAAVNAGIVVCSTTGYGQDGPRAQWAGHDLNYLGVTGYLHCSGADDRGAPSLPGASIADSAGGGLHAVVSILAALNHRHRTGLGTHLDVSIADGMLSLMALAVDEHLATGVDPGPRHGVLTGRYAWYDIYGTADGRWVTVAAIEPRFFENLCRALDCERWIGRQYDDDAVDEMRADFTREFARRDRDDWVTELGPGDACIAPVLDITEVALDPQFSARGGLVEVEHPVEGTITQVSSVLAGQVDATTQMVPDMSETHTAEVFGAAGFDADEVRSLLAAGVIG